MTRTKDMSELASAFRDVAEELQRRTIELEAAAVRYETALEAAPVAMLMVDDAGQIVLLNKQAEALFDYNRANLIGQSIELLVPDSVKARHPGLRAGFFADAKTRRMGAGRDLTARRRDGSEVPVEIGLNPIETAEETFVIASVVDISERRAAEQRFRLALEAAPNAMLMVDASGSIVLLNQQAEVLFGYSRQELLGQSVELLVPDSVRPRHPTMRGSFFLEPRARAMGAGRDLAARRKDGTEIPVEIGLNPIETSDGTLVMASIVDISERKLADQRLLGEQVALRRSRELEQFSYLASHDLRQPLNTVISFSTILAEDYAEQLDETGRAAIEFINQAAHRMANLIVDLLDYSRLRAEDTAKRVSCAELVEQVCDDLGAVIDQTGTQVVVRDLPELDAYPTQLRLLFQNLVANAIKFRRPDVTPRILIEGRPHADGLHHEIDFIDNGIGIDRQFAGRIFEIFQRLHSQEEFEGTGIGLAHCRKVAELHQGSITLLPTEGPGSTFRVVLPTHLAENK